MTAEYATIEITEKDYTVNENNCWVWKWATTSDYGVIKRRKIRKVAIRVHIIMYVKTFGPVPEGKEIDHKCNNRRCINPKHLQAITHAENIARAFENKPKECILGHGSLHARPCDGWLHCQTCLNDKQRKRLAGIRRQNAAYPL